MDCRLAFASPRGLPDTGFKTGSADDLPSEPPGKPLICVSHEKLWKILKEIRIPDNCFIGNCACRSRHNSWNWIRKNELVQNKEGNTSRLYVVTQLI